MLDRNNCDAVRLRISVDNPREMTLFCNKLATLGLRCKTLEYRFLNRGMVARIQIDLSDKIEAKDKPQNERND